MKKPLTKSKPTAPAVSHDYSGLVKGVSELLEAARHASVRTVNAFMTAPYWEVGRRIVEFEQNGSDRAKHGDAVVVRRAADIIKQLWLGFSRRNVFLMRALYLVLPRPLRTPSTAPVLPGEKVQTVFAQFSLSENGQPAGISQTPSRILSLEGLRNLALSGNVQDALIERAERGV
jgi:hypothetical protein